nr:hypothetical protein [Tanacetum cinerariifolium]
MQTTRQVINNTNHLSSSFQPAIRPSFLYDICQNSSSSSSSLQAFVGPDVHQNSSSSSSSSLSQSLQSQPTVHEPTLHQSSSLNTLRTQKMTAKQVYKLKGDAKDRKECKESCAAMFIAELRRRFRIPQGESVDKVLSVMFSVKCRTVKYRLKPGLYQQAANKLNEANGINGLDQE